MTEAKDACHCRRCLGRPDPRRCRRRCRRQALHRRRHQRHHHRRSRRHLIAAASISTLLASSDLAAASITPSLTITLASSTTIAATLTAAALAAALTASTAAVLTAVAALGKLKLRRSPGLTSSHPRTPAGVRKLGKGRGLCSGAGLVYGLTNGVGAV